MKGGWGGGGVKLTPSTPGKTALKKSSLIRVKDTRLKAFDLFKSKQKTDEVMLFYMQKCVYSEGLLNTLYIEIKHDKC